MRIFHEFTTAAWEVVKLPFWLIGLGWRRFVALGGRRIVLLAVAAVVVTVVALTVMVEATSQPGFCVSCHFMKPYFDSWHLSKHKDVKCIECHIPPGVGGTVKAKFIALSMVVDYWTGVYKRSKPWAEIDDGSCLRGGCHETRLLKGTENFKGVTFDHTPHLTKTRRDRQLRCTSCHGQIVQGEHITVTEGTCFLCHFKPDKNGVATDLARCTHCHTPPQGQAAADTSFDHTQVLSRGVDCLSCHATAVSGDGYVSKDRCNTCHAKQEHIEKFNDLNFVHQKHVTEHKVDCLSCHTAIRHGKTAATAGDPEEKCMQCHGGKDSPISAVWHGKLPGIPATPSKMASLKMSCNSCHVEPVHANLTAGKKNEQSKPECSPCHAANYNSLWPMWKGPLNQAIGAMQQDLKKMPAGGERDTLQKALDIYRDGNPVHNPDLAAILSEKISHKSESGTDKCTSCHAAAVNMAPPWHGRNVPHSVHAAAKVACETCHMSEQPNHGKLKLSPEQCNTCHHQKAAAANCQSCHSEQNKVYTGKIDNPAGVIPSKMSEASVGCTDCHAVANGKVTRRDPQTCVGCHEASYADTLNSWQKQSLSLLTALDKQLSSLSPTSAQYQSIQKLSAAMRRDGSRSVHNPGLFSDWKKRVEVAR